MQPASSPPGRPSGPAGAASSGLGPEPGGQVWHTLSAGQVLQAQQVDGQRGLSPAEVTSRAQRFGRKKFAEAKTEPPWRAFAAKGGVDAASTRQAYPRIAELPFDAAYKLMATFHKMTSESGTPVVRCFVKGAPDQLLARAATVFDADAGAVPADGEFRQRYLAENQRLGEQGLRVLATARKDFARPPSPRPRSRASWASTAR